MEAEQTAAAPGGHPSVAYGKTGLLFVNLGTPDRPEPAAIRRYLKEFLSDRRVIELPPPVWQLILRCFILPFRPKKLAHNYELVWLKDKDESPLAYYTKRQAQMTAEALRAAGRDGGVLCDYAMRYGNPSIRSKIEALSEQGAERIIIMPLYPQYSATTTATACDAVFDALKTLRRQPAIAVIPPFYDHPAYIDALAGHYAEALQAQGAPEDVHMLFSFHGLPQRYFRKGDPYHCHCRKTARLLSEKMALPAERVSVAFQSRFGKDAWLQPYAEPYIQELPAKGVKRLAIAAPGFPADCLETLEEIAVGFRDTFLTAGGEAFYYLPALNDSARAAACFAALSGPFVDTYRK